MHSQQLPTFHFSLFSLHGIFINQLRQAGIDALYRLHQSSLLTRGILHAIIILCSLFAVFEYSTIVVSLPHP